jgi:transcriptional regulator with XRE-family HTH domain
MPKSEETVLLGEKLKKVRTEQRLSLEDLAQKSKLTRSFLSQIEKNKTSPSINSLIRIAHALGINVGDFFREENSSESYVLHKEDRISFSIGRNQVTVELLTHRKTNRAFDPVFVRMRAGSDSGTIDSAGPFFMVILEGNLELSIGNEIHVLAEGDSIYIDEPIETRSKNIGDTDVVAFAVASTPIV